MTHTDRHWCDAHRCTHIKARHNVNQTERGTERKRQRETGRNGKKQNETEEERET